MPNIYFNTNLEYLRKSKGWTQSELADKLGVTWGVISHWENGLRQPRMEHIGKIADLFNVGSELLFNDLRLEKNTKEKEIINNVKLMTPEEQEKVLAMIELIKK